MHSKGALAAAASTPLGPRAHSILVGCAANAPWCGIPAEAVGY
jgi:hypothetical protein